MSQDNEKDKEFREVERKSDWVRGILAEEREKAFGIDEDGDWEHDNKVCGHVGG